MAARRQTSGADCRRLTAAMRIQRARGLLSIFAGISSLLAAIGIYGLMSYTVQQRVQEIGIRVALGAARRDVMKPIVFGGIKLTPIGVAAGLPGLRPSDLVRFRNRSLTFAAPFRAANVRERFS
jgi:hypothetical protein